jgi:hypothetical protein
MDATVTLLWLNGRHGEQEWRRLKSKEKTKEQIKTYLLSCEQYL